MNPMSPFILNAQITPPAGGGAFGPGNQATRLENPFGNPMWLDEIRIRLPAGSNPTPTGKSTGDGWAGLSLELKLGNLSLTKGFVPISLFGKVLNDDALSEQTTNANSVVEIGDDPFGPGIFTWKLPKPLFIPAREYLRPTMYLTPYSGAPTSTVTILYVCRPLPRGTPTPSRLQSPWVSSFMPPMIAPSSDLTNQSTPADLYNPWDEELHVQRFIGRLMIQSSGNSGNADNSGEAANHMSLASANVDLTTGIITCGTLVSAQDGYNNILIRDLTPFAHVFDFLDRSWTVNCILPPKGFYLFTVDRLWAGYTGTVALATVGISMVGYREVRYTP